MGVDALCRLPVDVRQEEGDLDAGREQSENMHDDEQTSVDDGG